MTPLQIILTLVGIAITAAASYGAARYAGRSAVKVKEIDVDAAAYERAEKINAAAFERIERELKAQGEELGKVKKGHEEQGEKLKQVETKADLATRDLGIAINWLEQFLMWEQDGSRPPRPHIPTALRKHINQALLIEQRKEQLEHNREQAS